MAPVQCQATHAAARHRPAAGHGRRIPTCRAATATAAAAPAQCAAAAVVGILVACGDQRQCSCRPPSSARQVRLSPNLRAQQTMLAPGRLVRQCACVCGSTSYNALCSQVLGKRREPPCHELPAALHRSESGPDSAQQPPAPAISAPDCGLALRRLQEDLQRFRCFSSLRDDEAASDHEGHTAAGPAASKHTPYCSDRGDLPGYCHLPCSAAAAFS